MNKVLSLLISILVIAGGNCNSIAGLTIDKLDYGGSTPVIYDTKYSVFQPFACPTVFHLNDGSSWNYCGGGYSMGLVKLKSEFIQDNIIHYTMDAPKAGFLLMHDIQGTKYCSHGDLVPAGPLVLDAIIGSKIATMHGFVKITLNSELPGKGREFNYFSATVGQIVPWEATYTLTSGTWKSEIFDTNFNYRISGGIDFAHPVPEPSTIALFGMGGIGIIAFTWRRRKA